MQSAASESSRERWQRRAITVPAYAVMCVAALTFYPVALPVLALADLLRQRPWVLCRAVSFFTLYLCCELLGILVGFVIWVTCGPWLRGDQTRFLQRNFRLQCWWARTLLAGATEIFGLRFAVEITPQVARGPMLLFLRHTSMGDTLLPAVFLSNRFGIVLRYVLKRELLWDPCLDIVGQRIPNYFARRGSGDSVREIAAVQDLLRDLGPQDGVLIYPEGTRLTPDKRRRALAKIEQGGTAELLRLAQGLRHTLPPRLGGSLGLLEKNPGADVVFCAHTGFEGAATFNDLMKGTLVNQTIRVAFWRVAFAEIPTEPTAQIEWLYHHWQRIDDWVGVNAGLKQ